MANFCQFFKSTDLNAPPLSGQAGALLRVLNALLVDGSGFSGVSVTSITRVGTTATATVSAADGLRLKTGMYITISGATGADAALYNGTFLITVASTTTFTYTMAGTPTGSATGTLLMSALLPISSITQTGGVATVTTAVNHGMATGVVVDISGATQAGYNLSQVPITVTAVNQFTYAVAGGTASPATGSPVYQRSPLQWTRPFAAGTNSQTFRSADSSSNRFYLQVIDNAATAGGAKEAQVYGAEVMSADQTVISGQWPTVAQAANGLCCRKSTTADAVQRAYTLWGDDRTFYLMTVSGDALGVQVQSRFGFGFGYFATYKAADGFNTFMLGSPTFNSVIASYFACTAIGGNVGAGGNFYLPRAYTQIGSSISCWMGLWGWGSQSTSTLCAPASAGSRGGGVCVEYPNSPDNGLFAWPIFVLDGNASNAARIRGRMPGIFAPMHAAPFTEGDESTGINGLPGVTAVAVNLSASDGSGGQVAQILVDKFGPYQ